MVAELVLENRLLKKKHDRGWGGRGMRYPAAGTQFGDLNGVAVEAVTVPDAPATPGSQAGDAFNPQPDPPGRG